MIPFVRLAGSTLAVLLAASATAQVAPIDASGLPGRYTVVLGPNGTFVCEPAVEEDGRLDVARVGGAPALTVLPSLNPPEELTGLRIVLRATDQLLDRPDALLAFRRAAARWERAIKTPITIVYDIDYGPTRFGGDPYAPTTIASANSAASIAFNTGGSPATPSQVLAVMTGKAADDAQLQALYAAVPDPIPSTVVDGDGDETTRAPIGFVYGGQPTLQMLGYAPAALDPDPTVNPFGEVPNLGFNSAFDFDFDPNDGTDAALIDFEAIVIHEMGHSLGFTSAVGFAQQNFGVLATPWDLFRVRPDSVTAGESLTDGRGWETTPRVVTPGPPPSRTVEQGGETYFLAEHAFFDGLGVYETSTATGTRVGGDGQQASHWRDDSQRPPVPLDSGDRYIGIMDPNFGPGVRQLYKYPDLRVLETLGYEVEYAPSYATGIDLSIDGADVDVDTLSVEPVRLGDVAVGGTREVAVEVRNPDALSPRLAFDAEVVVDGRIPAGATPSATLGTTEGVVEAGGAQTLQLTIGGASEPSFFVGRLRIRTNADSALVIEVPFEFSVGGATEPLLTLAEGDGADDGRLGDFGNLTGAESASATFTVGNAGTLPLQYEVVTGLQTRKFPFLNEPTPRDARRAAPARALRAFVGARAAAEATTLFETDFEGADPLAPFTTGGSAPGDWRIVTGGSSQLSGHSQPTSLYFGKITLEGGVDVYQYADNATGQILFPEIDLSSYTPDDLVLLTFNYYLQAEEGFDFASVLYSVDGGTTFEEAATSDQGLLTNTDDGWTSVMVNLAALSGLEDPVRLAFQFQSDGNVTDEGWYLDDVEVSVTEGVNPFYATPRVGSVTGPTATEDVTVTARAGFLESGFYRGTVSVVTNQRADDPAPLQVQFEIDSPAFPTLLPSEPTVSRSIREGQTEDVDVILTNAGDAPLTYLRLLEPALSRFRADPSPARLAPSSADYERVDGLVTDEARTARTAEVAASTTTASRALGVLDLPTTFAVAFTQLPDGRLVAAEVGSGTAPGRTFVIAEDLSSFESYDGVVPTGQQVLGLTYNDRTESLWYAGFQSGRLYEVTLGDGGLTLTGETVDLGFQVSALDYSPALDAFLTIPYNSNLVEAYDLDANPLPGYADVRFARGSFYQGLSMTGGVLEIGFLDLSNGDGDQISFVQYDQFGELVSGAIPFDLTDAAFDGVSSAAAFRRSLTDPDGAFYLLTRPTRDASGVPTGPAKVISVDPPDLPVSTQTFVSALRPAFGNDVETGETGVVTVRLSPDAPGGSVVRDTLAFLTNNPAAQVVEVPVEVSVLMSTDAADAPVPDAFAVYGVRPNPTRGSATVHFGLPEAADVTVEVYNAIGQRVAVLADARPMAAGEQSVPLGTQGLPAGVYVVRVQAGADADARKLVVVR